MGSIWKNTSESKHPPTACELLKVTLLSRRGDGEGHKRGFNQKKMGSGRFLPCRNTQGPTCRLNACLAFLLPLSVCKAARNVLRFCC